jgi:hypothetical protein
VKISFLNSSETVADSKFSMQTGADQVSVAGYRNVLQSV